MLAELLHALCNVGNLHLAGDLRACPPLCPRKSCLLLLLPFWGFLLPIAFLSSFPSGSPGKALRYSCPSGALH